MPTPLESLRSMSGLSNLTPTGDAYFDKRKARIVSGQDQLEPTDYDLKLMQMESPVGGSRDEIRDSVFAKIKNMLAMKQAEHAQEMEGKLAPIDLKGRYDLEAAGREAEIADKRLQQSQAFTAGQNQLNRDAYTDRAVLTGGTFDQKNAAKRAIPASVLTNMATQRGMLEREVAKGEPGALGKFFGRQNPQAARLTGFDAAKSAAEQLYQMGESDTARLGEIADNVSPQDEAQVRAFLLMMTGGR